MGCFWGAERKYWTAPGVYTTAVGYAGGFTPNPSYEEVCSGRTGHTEVVLAVFDPAVTSYEEMCKVFWENHDPTQGMRQGNDIGTQYRSAIYWHDRLRSAPSPKARATCSSGCSTTPGGATSPPRSPRPGPSTTPRATTSSTSPRTRNGYCGLGGTGLSCPVGVAKAE